mgnify:CR=1 FL=1
MVQNPQTGASWRHWRQCGADIEFGFANVIEDLPTHCPPVVQLRLAVVHLGPVRVELGARFRKEFAGVSERNADALSYLTEAHRRSWQTDVGMNRYALFLDE